MAFLDDFLDHLRLDSVAADHFQGETRYMIAANHIYGGQVMSQALSAASQTVAEGRYCHNYAVQFLRGGRTDAPIDFWVERVKDGRNFSVRRVLAEQGGKKLLSLEGSFHIEADGLERQQHCDNTVGPENLRDLASYKADFAARNQMGLYDFLVTNNILEFRCQEMPSYIESRDRPAAQKMWVRAKYPLATDQNLQRILLAYISDHNFLRTATLPYRSQIEIKPFQFASLNHAMWIHRPINLNHWHLFDVTSPNAYGQRSQVMGHFYNESGEMVATAIQEGLLKALTADEVVPFSNTV
ncbi:acyl-CoA thioesterase [Spongiibacter sp. IMCC21906]|uniref:acyl-CoA thioesterase n=1 Tax=Spongiibacter sp. IMCC21906 TaxID=1620392 RepID=UPI00062DDFBD|nr:acyl-CoA thioesterase domain-containing protein [Spongiibacter sp. IMCC21906]AKH70480.1 acyl-CoA thioesterase [Spongiibacter sp. IMCC21906]